MIELPEGSWFYLLDTAPFSATDPQPFPTWTRKRPPPWRFVSGLRRAAVGPGEYPQFQQDALAAEPGEIRERDDHPEEFVVWSRQG